MSLVLQGVCEHGGGGVNSPEGVRRAAQHSCKETTQHTLLRKRTRHALVSCWCCCELWDVDHYTLDSLSDS